VYALLHARMAPVQVLLYGSQSSLALTSGLPASVDYIGSGDALAGLGWDRAVSEQSVRVGALGLFAAPLRPPTVKEHWDAVSKAGLLDGTRYVLIPRPLVALHPAMDEAIGAVLRLGGTQYQDEDMAGERDI